MGGADPDVQYDLITDASKLYLGGVSFQLKDAPTGTEATDNYKENLQVIMFMLFRLGDVENRNSIVVRLEVIPPRGV
ncbi:hypothetical protein MMC29_000059 [Sticta canariensis]|nr:hypothetical protein [Sticta canariensis]